MTPSVSSKGTLDASNRGQGVTASLSDRCTSGCTSNPETGPAMLSVEALTAALQALSPTDRARLAALLVGEQGEGAGK